MKILPLRSPSVPVSPTTSVAVSGTALEVEVRRLLGSLAYPPCNVQAALSWVESHGTIVGCPFVEREDHGAITGLLAAHADYHESDPADWPAWTDAERWVSAGDDDAPFEPTADEATWWAAESDSMTTAEVNRHYDLMAEESHAVELMSVGLTPFPLAPICGGSPDDRRWDDRGGVRSRPVKGWSDADQYRAHGAV